MHWRSPSHSGSKRVQIRQTKRNHPTKLHRNNLDRTFNDTRTNRTVEVTVAQTMVERVSHRFDLWLQRLAGDTVYGAVRLLKWLVERKITPHVPVWDKSAVMWGVSL